MSSSRPETEENLLSADSGNRRERKKTALQKLTFRPLTTEDLPWLRRCRDAEAHPFTALNAVSLITWAETYGLSVGGDEDFFVIRSRYDEGYYAPAGDPDKCEAFIEKTAGEEKPARFLYLTETEARRLALKGWKAHFRADLSEYIASSSSLAMAPGSFISESYRRKCRKFAKAFGRYRVTPVTAENMDRLRATADRYREARRSLPADQAVLETELEHYGDLNMKGILLTMPDGREAFILGYENIPGMFTMTMTRHDPTLPPEITTVCIHEFAALLQQKYPLINVEEDMGLEGLHQAKLLLSPVDFLKVYEVIR